MKRQLHEHFGYVYEPSSFGELIKLVAGTKDDSAPVRMWRGQSDEKWLLHSSAYRKLLNSGDQPAERSVASYERRLLDKATHKGFRFFEGRELSDFELLARLQHHGAATRLIDTTRSALIALYFACAEPSDRAGMLFGIHTDHLGGGEGKLLTDTYEEYVKRIAPLPHPQTWEPPLVSRRIAAQHSQFVLSGVKEGLSHGSLALGEINKTLLAIRIPPARKSEYRHILQGNFDITALSLFPDLDGFGAAHSHALDQWSNERW